MAAAGSSHQMEVAAAVDTGAAVMTQDEGVEAAGTDLFCLY